MIYKLRVIFTRRQKMKFALLFLLLFTGALLEFLGVSMVLPFVELVMGTEGGEKSGLMIKLGALFQTESKEELLLLTGLGLVLIYLLKNVYLILMKGLELRFIFNNRLELSGRLMRSYMKKPYTFHLEKHSSEVLQNVTFDVNKLYDLILYGMELVSDLLIIGMLSVYLLLQDALITIATAVLLGSCSFACFCLMGKRTRAYGRQNQLYNSRMLQAVGQALGGIKEIKLLAREEYFVQAYEENGRYYAGSLKRSQFFQYMPKYIIETVCVCGILGVVLLRIFLGAKTEELIPLLSVFAVAAFRLLPSVNAVNRLMSNILFLLPSVDKIYEDLQNAEDVQGEHGFVRDKDLLQPAEQIRFQDVSYRYPGAGREVLSHVDIEIPIGSSVGFVGSSGAGKTTFMDLLLGLLRPDGGKVLYGEQDIQAYKESWRQKLGYIPQTIYLTDDTIRRNVAFGIPDSLIDDEKVWKALDRAQLSGFVRGLEKGLDTKAGEAGVRLSGGQRQRIGIARALYKEPEILVLDEATSALDTETEQAVMDAVEHLKGTCTLLLIAHRLSTLKACDRIFRVENGRVFVQ